MRQSIALMLGALLLASPAHAICTDESTSATVEVACDPATIESGGETECVASITNTNTCRAIIFEPRIGITTDYYPEDPGGIVSGDSLNARSVRVRPLHTRYFDFVVPLDEYSEYVDVLVHLTARQAHTGATWQGFQPVRVFAAP